MRREERDDESTKRTHKYYTLASGKLRGVLGAEAPATRPNELNEREGLDVHQENAGRFVGAGDGTHTHASIGAKHASKLAAGDCVDQAHL